MVATRGAVYTKATASFACHDHCNCEARTVFGDEPIRVAAYKPTDRTITDADRARVRQWIAEHLD